MFSCVQVVNNIDNQDGWRGCPGPKKREITAFGVEQGMCVLYVYAVGALLCVCVCVCYIWRARQKACRSLWRPKGLCVYHINMSYCLHVYMLYNFRRQRRLARVPRARGKGWRGLWRRKDVCVLYAYDLYTYILCILYIL